MSVLLNPLISPSEKNTEHNVNSELRCMYRNFKQKRTDFQDTLTSMKSMELSTLMLLPELLLQIHTICGSQNALSKWIHKISSLKRGLLITYIISTWC